MSTLKTDVLKDVAETVSINVVDLLGATNLRQDLADDGGSDLIGFIHSDLAAVTRTAAEKMGDTVSVLDFMTPAERDDTRLAQPLLDHAAAFQAAIDAVSTSSGVAMRGRAVYLPGGRNYRLATSITLRSGTALCGEYSGIQDNYAATQPVIPSALFLASGVTITGQIGVNFRGLAILKDGLTYPQNQTQVAAWTGTAITLPNNGASIEKCLIVGFNLAVSAVGHSRLRMTEVLIDCLNGVDNSGSFDITYLNKVHCWPYASQTLTPADFVRGGFGIKLHDVADWAKLTDCFTYGYFRGFWFANVGAVTATNCSADNASGELVGAYGFLIEGVGGEIRLIAPQAAGQAIGIFINVVGPDSSTGNTFIINPNLWSNSSRGIQIDSASGIQIQGGHVRASPNGITINNAGVYGTIRDVRFANSITTDCVQYTALAPNIRVHGLNLESGGTGRIESTNRGAVVVPSAATLLLNQFRDCMNVSGTVGITAIDGATSCVDREVSLRFLDSLTLTASSNLSLRGGVNANVVAGNSIDFRYFGDGIWRETARNF